MNNVFYYAVYLPVIKLTKIHTVHLKNKKQLKSKIGL